MNRIFAITAASERVVIGGDGRGEITFTVTNSSKRALRGQLRVRPLGSTREEWLSLAGESERAFSPNATQQVVVKVATPPGAPAGKYQFRLDAISVVNPDDDFTEGPTVDLEVKATEAPKKAFPWRLVAAAAGAVVLIVTLTWLLWPSGVEVPEVLGLDVAEAAKKIEDAKLKVEVKRQPNDSVAAERVFAQEPAGRSKVEEGAAVTLLVAEKRAEQKEGPKEDGPKVIFEDDFDGAWKPVWSQTRTDMTPRTKTRFLGPFWNEQVKLIVEGAPPHKNVTVKFDLYIINSWDGDATIHGPDGWGLKLEDNLDLIYTTFSNQEGGTQKFACKAGEDASTGCFGKVAGPAFGAAAINSLGFDSWLKKKDCVYKIKRTFPHERSFLILTFFGKLAEGDPSYANINNEAWGLDNVRIEAQ